MCKYLLPLFITLLLSTSVYATPELKGSPTELLNYLESLPREVSLRGNAKIILQAENGVVTIGIRTENSQLQKALRNSQGLRQKITKQMTNSGISLARIKGTKFSSTPEYGLFGKKPKNYLVDSLLKIIVETESELQEVAGIVDNNEHVYYQGLELKEQEKEVIKKQLLNMALANANKRKEIYENQLNLILKPISFDENISVEQPEFKQPRVNSKRVYSSSIGSGGNYPADLSLGEHIYQGSVHVTYEVNEKNN